MTDLVELGAVLGAFFDDGLGPSHDQLDQAFLRHGLADGDPAPGGRTSQGATLGKTKRIRRVFVYATDRRVSAGLPLAKEIVALLRAEGAFSSSLPGYAGEQKISRLTSAFKGFGMTLAEGGELRPTVIDNLAGTDLTEALRMYVQRINLNPDDAPLQVGTGKELDEAVARHVLEERTGSYPVGGSAGSFPVTLASAFATLGFAVGSVPGSGVSDGGVSVPDVRGPSRESLW
ncbi:hypothetical protein [Mycobacterium avium]|uniref:hypothetical protein n=1 Tax=Mycobacterium avium TaxID=1764 RepID=UPI0012DA6931|nr:hypothetical protein [Mycobacterium avium]